MRGIYQTRVPALADRMVSPDVAFGRWAIRLKRKTPTPVVLVSGDLALRLVRAGQADFEGVDSAAAISHLERLTKQP